MKSLEIFLRKIILKFLLLFKKERTKRKPSLPDKSSKILIVRLNRIGDALVTTPLLTVLKKTCDSQITVLADRKNSFVFEHCPAVDEIIIFRKGIKGFLGIIREINKKKYDFVVDLHDDVSTTVSFLLAMIDSPNILGLKKNTELLYTYTCTKLQPSENHVVDRTMSILGAWEIDFHDESINISYEVSDKTDSKIKSLIGSYFPDKKFLLGINISAGSSARFWGIENFIRLLDNLDEGKYDIILLCAPSDVNLLNTLNKGSYKSYFTPDFEEFAAVVSNLDLLFTPDTSVVHIASAFGIPVFGLYVQYNTDDIIWYPYKSTYEAVITKEPDFKNLSFETVIDKFNPFLETIYNAKRNSKM